MITVISCLLALLLSVLIYKLGYKHLIPCIVIVFGALSYSQVNMLFMRTDNLSSSKFNVVLVAVTVVLTILVGAYFTVLLSKQTAIVNDNSVGRHSEKISLNAMLVVISTAVVTISFVSKSSPLYAFNDWFDPNYFLTVGRGMLKGAVPYRDLYEQKGPILYYLHALAVLVDGTGFLGVYLIEVISAVLFLYFSLKLLQLFVDEDVILFIPVLAAVVYSSYTLDKGDSCEELCLWCLVYSMYIGFRIIKQDTSLKRIEYFFIGFLGAVILWTKYLMLGFFIGWIIAILAYLKINKEISKLFEIFGFAALGAVVCSMLTCSYFAAHGALGDLFQAYFYNNMFLYDPNGSNGLVAIIKNVVVGGLKCVKNPFVSMLIIFGVIALKKLKNSYMLFYISCLFGTMFFIYFKGSYRYYSFCLGALAPVGIILLYHFVKQHVLNDTNKKTVYCGALIVSCIFLTFCPNLRYLSETKENMVQYQFRDIIMQEKDPVLLSFHIMDFGFYNVCGITPECKYFCTYNILKDYVSEEQLNYIKEKKPDFIVTSTEESLPDYVLASNADYYDRVLDITRHYYLYKKSALVVENR